MRENMNHIEGAKEFDRYVFNKQFERTRTHEIDGREVRYAIVTHQENPNAEWFVYIGGFGQGKDGYANALYDVASSGKNILYINPLKGVPLVDKKKKEELDALGVPQVLANKANEVSRLMEELGIEKAHVGGHSQGAAAASVLTAMNSEKIGNMILDTPAGLREGDSILRVIWSTVVGKGEQRADIRQVEELARSAKPHDGETEEDYKKRIEGLMDRAGLWKTVGKASEVYTQLLWRLTYEVPALASFDMRPVLRRVRELQGGEKRDATKHRIAVLTANRDRTYEPANIQNAVGDVVDDPATLADVTASYVGRNEMHNAAIFAPAGAYSQFLAK